MTYGEKMIWAAAYVHTLKENEGLADKSDDLAHAAAIRSEAPLTAAEQAQLVVCRFRESYDRLHARHGRNSSVIRMANEMQMEPKARRV